MVLDRNGQTALHLACEHGSLHCLRELLEGSPTPLDLEARNFEGEYGQVGRKWVRVEGTGENMIFFFPTR